MKSPLVRDIVGVAIFSLAVMLAIALVAVGIGRGIREMDQRKCDRLAEQIGQPTDWVDYHVMSWDCLTVVDGQQIRADDYFEYLNAKLLNGEED